MLERKLQRDREELAARERAEELERQRKLNELKRTNELIHQDAIVRTKHKEFRTPQVTTNKALNLGYDGYDELEKMLVRNAHNELRNDFNLSIERMRQEFSMTNKKMETQISTLMKLTDKEKEEKKRLQNEIENLRNKAKEEEAKEELKRLIVLSNLDQKTVKLPRTSKINFEVKTLVDTTGYNPLRVYNEPIDSYKTMNRHDFK